MKQNYIGRQWYNIFMQEVRAFIFLALQQLVARLDWVDFSFEGQGCIGQDYVTRN